MTDNSVSFNDEGGVTVDGAPRVLGSRLARRLGLASRVEVDELEASRARVVAAADAQRRRIERDLHDGAQQHLVALAVNLQVARQLADSDPDAAKALLEEIAADVREALESCGSWRRGSTRRCFSTAASPRLSGPQRLEPGLGTRGGAGGPVLARGRGDRVLLLPRGPEERGRARRCGSARDRPRLDEQGALLFEVVDDGVGFEQSVTRWGAGLSSISDRLGALGGRLTLSSEPGHGTRVSGTIPLAP